jgi:hypothetical protein
MADDDLVNFRQDLADDFGSLWDDLEDVIADMKRDFDQEDRDMFKECTNDDSLPRGNSLTECLEETAAEVGVAESFRRRLNQADGLVSSLREQGRSAANSNNVSEAVRSAADFTSAAEINRMCARGNYSDVEDEVGDGVLDVVDGSIDSYQDCVTASAEQAGLRQSLKSAYGTT